MNHLKSFEKIAKEGRKYGVSLVIVSQRLAGIEYNNFTM